MTKFSGLIASPIVLVCTASLLFCGCVSTYQGPGPNFELKGASAEREMHRHKLGHSTFTNWRALSMGPERDLYYTSSLEPMISRTSPEALATLTSARLWGWGSLAVVLAGSAYVLMNEDRTGSVMMVGYSVMGLGFMGSVYSHILSSEACDQFNRDMENKFRRGPVASLQFEF